MIRLLITALILVIVATVVYVIAVALGLPGPIPLIAALLVVLLGFAGAATRGGDGGAVL